MHRPVTVKDKGGFVKFSQRDKAYSMPGSGRNCRVANKACFRNG